MQRRTHEREERTASGVVEKRFARSALPERRSKRRDARDLHFAIDLSPVSGGPIRGPIRIRIPVLLEGLLVAELGPVT